jgi:hypothetical protein
LLSADTRFVDTPPSARRGHRQKHFIERQGGEGEAEGEEEGEARDEVGEPVEEWDDGEPAGDADTAGGPSDADGDVDIESLSPVQRWRLRQSQRAGNAAFRTNGKLRRVFVTRPLSAPNLHRLAMHDQMARLRLPYDGAVDTIAMQRVYSPLSSRNKMLEVPTSVHASHNRRGGDSPIKPAVPYGGIGDAELKRMYGHMSSERWRLRKLARRRLGVPSTLDSEAAWRGTRAGALGKSAGSMRFVQGDEALGA